MISTPFFVFALIAFILSTWHGIEPQESLVFWLLSAVLLAACLLRLLQWLRWKDETTMGTSIILALNGVSDRRETPRLIAAWAVLVVGVVVGAVGVWLVQAIPESESRVLALGVLFGGVSIALHCFEYITDTTTAMQLGAMARAFRSGPKP